MNETGKSMIAIAVTRVLRKYEEQGLLRTGVGRGPRNRVTMKVDMRPKTIAICRAGEPVRRVPFKPRDTNFTADDGVWKVGVDRSDKPDVGVEFKARMTKDGIKIGGIDDDDG
jgi:hypothetical protein